MLLMFLFPIAVALFEHTLESILFILLLVYRFCYRFAERVVRFAPCKIVRILESRKHLLVESRIQKIFDCVICNHSFCNPESMLRNPESWTIDLLESGIPENRPFEIRNPLRSLRWNLKSSIWDPESESWNQDPRLSRITVHGAMIITLTRFIVYKPSVSFYDPQLNACTSRILMAFMQCLHAHQTFSLTRLS